MGINQDTCQTYCLKRIVALGEFVPADTAAVCQDVVVPDNEFNVQDGRSGSLMSPSITITLSTPHVGSKSEFALAVH